MRWHANTPRWLAIALALTVALLLGGSATAAGPHSAGIVVRHGDGTLVYVWVSFEEDSITSEELLTRSGLAFICSNVWIASAVVLESPAPAGSPVKPHEPSFA